MNILFLTIVKIDSVSDRGIYTDLLRKFRDEGHNVFAVSPAERRYKKPTSLINDDGVKSLKVKTLNFQKTNLIEKGIGTILVEYQFKRAIKKYLNNIKFDLVLYSTPPITFTNVVKFIKKKDSAKSYLLLKDIFPQNAADLGMIKPKGLLFSFFKKKEKEIYSVSDYIGCMSPANKAYLQKQNPEISSDKIEICPNSIEIANVQPNKNNTFIREKFEIPTDERTVFIYGGNLGKPQGIDFLIEILKSNNHKSDRFFVIAGSGTEYFKIEQAFKTNQFSNAKLIPNLPKNEYDQLVQTSDVGLIFLDPRFTIPNYPSRLLSYLEYKMPIIAATDAVSDIGQIAEKNQYGFFAHNGDLQQFNQQMEKFISDKSQISTMGENGYQFLTENYTVDKSYQIIMHHFEKKQ